MLNHDQIMNLASAGLVLVVLLYAAVLYLGICHARNRNRR